MFKHHLVCNNHEAEYGKDGCSCKGRNERIADLEKQLGQLRAASVTFDSPPTATNLLVFKPNRTWCNGYSAGCLMVVADDIENASAIVEAYNAIETQKQTAHDQWESSYKEKAKKIEEAKLTDDEMNNLLEKLYEEHEQERSLYPEGNEIVTNLKEQDNSQYGDREEYWVLQMSFSLHKPQKKQIVFNVLHTG